jgi:hypothetical protein
MKNTSKLKHLEHIEDFIINDGIEGAIDALHFLRRLIDVIDGTPDEELAVNLKIDGAPSLVCGTIPADEPDAGEFFVGTKSALSPTGKRYTRLNSKAIFEENSSGLADKLATALNYLPELGMDAVYQGDFLFTPTDLHPQYIHSKYLNTFKPNTLTYAIDDTSLGQYKMGIVFHTVYEGDTFADMHATFNPDLSKLNKDTNVWWKSNKIVDFKATIPHNPYEIDILYTKWVKAQEQLIQINHDVLDVLQLNPQLVSFLKMHINSKIRANEPMDDMYKHILHFAQFVYDRHDAAASKFKTEKKRDSIRADQQHHAGLITTHWHDLIEMFEFFNTITEIKLLILNNITGLDGIQSFYKDGDKFIKTAGEGLVIADTVSHDITKLVDRRVFSFLNFTQQKDW